MALPKRKLDVSLGGGLSPPWDDDMFKEEYPAIFAFLYDTKYEDGSQRAPGSISIFVNGYSLKFAVNDKDRGVVAFVTAPTWAEMMQIVDDGIRNDNLDWKAASKAQPGKNPPF